MVKTTTTLTIRRLTEDDEADMARLAELDSSAALQAPLLGVEIEDRLLAAVSIETGKVVADPFSRTAELRDLLELRATQLRGRRKRSRLALRSRRGPSGALAGSPPGAAGKLATLYSPGA
jgi:hypothetical protein